jgi:hypothetical protein
MTDFVFICASLLELPPELPIMNNDADLSTSVLFRALRAEGSDSAAALQQAASRAEERWPLLKSSKLVPWALLNGLSLSEKETRRHRDHDHASAANDATKLTASLTADRAASPKLLSLDARLAQGLLKMADGKPAHAQTTQIQPARSVQRMLATPLPTQPLTASASKMPHPWLQTHGLPTTKPMPQARAAATTAQSSLRSLLSKIEGGNTPSLVSTQSAPGRKVPSFLARLGPR